MAVCKNFKLYYGASATEITPTYMLSFPTTEKAEIDDTHLSSTFRTHVYGLEKGKDTKFKIGYSAALYKTLFDLKYSTIAWKVGFPDTSGHADFTGDLLDIEFDADDPDHLAQMTLTVRVMSTPGVTQGS